MLNGTKPALSGSALLLKSILPPQVFEAAEQLTSTESVAKNIAFADALPVLMQTLGAINERLEDIANGGSRPGGQLGRSDAEPGPGPGNAGGTDRSGDLGLPDEPGAG